MKLALVDLDGVVCNSDARFTKAETAKEAAFARNAPGHIATDVYWRTAFTPELIALDTPMEHANEALRHIKEDGFKVLFVSSRPEALRAATAEWLLSNIDIYTGSNMLILKPASQQYVKTLVWKPGVVEVLARLFCELPPSDELIFVDDEAPAREAIAVLDLPCNVRVASSLHEAEAFARASAEEARKVAMRDDDFDPFLEIDDLP